MNTKKDKIIEELRNSGLRITKQRKIIIDAILDYECSSCKEIYYQVCKSDPKIGIATVYRMIKVLEEIGAINRKNMYKISYEDVREMHSGCEIILDNEKSILLSGEDFGRIFEAGLKSCGYLGTERIEAFLMHGGPEIPERVCAS